MKSTRLMNEVVAPPRTDDLTELAALIRDRRLVVLAGAGCSTESGIPDYRGPGAASRQRTPIQYQEFIDLESARRRYWARSVVGWTRMAGARPNPAHRALASLEESGLLRGIITQNVDGLHGAAGSRRVVELHGSLGWVRCLGCGWKVPRGDYQESLRRENPDWTAELKHPGSAQEWRSAPDGDAEVPAWAIEGFRIPACAKCGGIMKPDVVFFGECVPPDCLAEAWGLFAEAEVLLVLGSSLTVYSGRRFIYRAEQTGVPIGIMNLGPTRADAMAAVRVEGRLGELLPRLANRLLSVSLPN